MVSREWSKQKKACRKNAECGKYENKNKIVKRTEHRYDLIVYLDHNEPY